MNVSQVVSDLGKCRVLKFKVFVYDGHEVGAKLVEWYHVASAMCAKPEIKVSEGYRVWVSEWSW